MWFRFEVNKLINCNVSSVFGVSRLFARMKLPFLGEKIGLWIRSAMKTPQNSNIWSSGRAEKVSLLCWTCNGHRLKSKTQKQGKREAEIERLG